ncbi:MAG TPA: fumarate hydratase [Coriobacteriaceae bacterium]|nr:fumarate hydratase [Coriobacteriaceae bacterium]
MRVIQTSEITNAVSELCIRANCVMNEGLLNALHEARDSEELPVAKATLGCMLENAAIAAGEMVPICQDTGAACVFVELGQDVHIEGGSLVDAINAGVAFGYTEGYLRKSMVADPLRRVNTDDNTPALITVDIVDGDALKITLAPKGAGSENMGQLKMLKPADGIDGVRDFVLDAVRHAGPNPCPPIIVGVGVGGNFDHVASLAKRALLRPVSVHNPDPFYAQLEVELLDAINAFGTGPAGFGGATTALAVNIEQAPTHIACLPVAVNINCHVARHEEVVL